MVTGGLFRRWPTRRGPGGGRRDDLEAVIRSTGFYRAKAKSILGCCQGARGSARWRGAHVSLADLVRLPGVGRKTANVVLGSAFGIAVGRGGRHARGPDLAPPRPDAAADAVRAERDLVIKACRPSHWIGFSHRLIELGRGACAARRPTVRSLPARRPLPAGRREGAAAGTLIRGLSTRLPHGGKPNGVDNASIRRSTRSCVPPPPAYGSPHDPLRPRDPAAARRQHRHRPVRREPAQSQQLQPLAPRRTARLRGGGARHAEEQPRRADLDSRRRARAHPQPALPRPHGRAHRDAQPRADDRGPQLDRPPGPVRARHGRASATSASAATGRSRCSPCSR
jgi:endonuclease III